MREQRPIYHISGAEYHSSSGIKFFEQDSIRETRTVKKNKHDQEGRWQLQNAKNENKYNTTCLRCGLISHRSVLCPTYPFSKTRCGICNRLHQTNEDREPGNLSW